MVSRITINGIPLLPGQTKAVKIALASLERDLTSAVARGFSSDKESDKAMLTLIQEVRELIRCGG